MAEKTLAEIETDIKKIQFEEAQLRLEETRERVEASKASKEVRSRQNRQRQGQLRADLIEKAQVIGGCTHKQGGSPGRERKGQGPSALRVVVLPDGRELIMCANCPMRVFSPLPSDNNPKPMKGESKAQAKKRVEEYQAAVAEFEKLKEQSQNQLTPEAGQPMHCGKQFAFTDRMGNNITMPAPCDEYAQGRDNRNVA